jgi:SRSO17 transposase
MILHTKGDNSAAIRAMQHFISEGAWDDRAVLQRHWQLVDETLGEEEGVLIADGTGFPKQGNQSVGVKRQWCGQLGKVANCQVGVFLGYASRHGRTLLDRRLYLPKEWVEDEAYAERRQQTGVPQDTQFQTKPQLATEMVTELVASETLRCRWITADEAFGRDSHFLDQVGVLLLKSL